MTNINNWSAAVKDGYEAISNVNNWTAKVIERELDNMASMFEERFNYEQHLKDLEISAEQKAQDLALEQTIKNLILLDTPIQDILKLGYTKEQVNIVLRKLNMETL